MQRYYVFVYSDRIDVKQATTLSTLAEIVDAVYNDALDCTIVEARNERDALTTYTLHLWNATRKRAQ